jgi:UDPglucose--hexose-1-phosphate uridylyltransferase
VAKIEFKKRTDQAWLLDPKDQFKRKSIAFELREDCLTGSRSRILPYRFKIPQMSIDGSMLEASRKNCPFCPERVASLTPRFIPEITSEGRVHRGRASLIPNSYPYARYSWVVILTDSHFLYLNEFSVDILEDAFLLAQNAVGLIKSHESKYDYCSINWNYLPESGGGLFHPHLQVVVEDVPTVSHRRVLEGVAAYQEDCGALFWMDWLSEEMRRGERYIGSQGDIHFVMAFSPIGVLGEILILFGHRSSLQEFTADDWGTFCEGLIKIFGYFKGKYIQSFNLSIFSGGAPGVESRVYARLCPRISIPPWNTSDVNYFEKLHDEVICIVHPEEMCAEIKPLFSV